MSKRLLLLSNSTNYGEDYLKWPQQHIAEFLGASVKKVLFIPFAGVTISWDNYTQRVAPVFHEIGGYEIEGIHKQKDAITAIENAEAIAVGGGNTWQLLKELYAQKLVEAIRSRVENGMPYMGWSAGSNVACPTIMTTNDMPIAEPPSFKALNLVPFQVNPHFTDAAIPNHGGETRSQRLAEFIAVNPEMYVVGLPEGALLQVEGSNLTAKGKKPLKLFKGGEPVRDISGENDLNFLI